MGQKELNPGLAKHMFPKGKSGNPEGKQGTPAMRRSWRTITEALLVGSEQPCGRPGFEHLTKFEYGIHTWLEQYMDGNEVARKHFLDRVFGRVPVNVALAAQVEHRSADLSYLTDEQLAERAAQLAERAAQLATANAEHRAALRAERLAEEHAKQLAEAIEGEVVADTGSGAAGE